MSSASTGVIRSDWPYQSCEVLLNGLQRVVSPRVTLVVRSRRAEIHCAHAQPALAQHRPGAIWRIPAMRTRPRQPAKTQLAQFGLAFDIDQPDNQY